MHCESDGGAPGLRCGHTLTAISPEKNPAAAKLVMFGAPHWATLQAMGVLLLRCGGDPTQLSQQLCLPGNKRRCNEQMNS